MIQLETALTAMQRAYDIAEAYRVNDLTIDLPDDEYARREAKYRELCANWHSARALAMATIFLHIKEMTE